jgi:glycosyltransferase involved in cell wall biosynthesis
VRFVFLYTEIAEYVLACCNELAKHGEVHIVRWPVNKEAPFQFRSQSKLKIYSKNDYTTETLAALVQGIQPDVIVCSGWIDKDYLKITKAYFKKIPTVMTCDTHWKGNIKQQAARIISRFTLLKIFSHAWVPGQAQKQYALKLGFNSQYIETGFYSCDLDHFESIYQEQKAQKSIRLPKRFLFVGRYYEFKGIKELWQAFIDVQAEFPNEWELWCLGVGDVEPVEHPKIKHFGFIQPKDMATYTAETGVFILPSRFEPWGVVVHEFAASGFPLLLSNEIGAGEQFLQEGKNGFSFQSGNTKAISKVLLKIIKSSEEELIKMAKVSNELSKTISPEKWTSNLLHILKRTPY